MYILKLYAYMSLPFWKGNRNWTKKDTNQHVLTNSDKLCERKKGTCERLSGGTSINWGNSGNLHLKSNLHVE